MKSSYQGWSYWKITLSSVASFIRMLESPLNVPNFKDLLPASSASMTLQNPDEVQPSSQTSSDHASSYLFPFPEQFVHLACNYVASLVVCLPSSLCVCFLRTSHISTLRAGTVVLYLLDLLWVFTQVHVVCNMFSISLIQESSSSWRLWLLTS